MYREFCDASHHLLWPQVVQLKLLTARSSSGRGADTSFSECDTSKLLTWPVGDLRKESEPASSFLLKSNFC